MTDRVEMDAGAVGFYADPMAYDILHGPGTTDEVRGLELVAGRFVTGEAREGWWLEPGCGSARLMRIAAMRGHRVVGFDLSEAMVEYARGRLKSAGVAGRGRVFVGDMESFVGRACPEGSCGFAFCTINSIRHLMSDDALLRHLGEVRRALLPGGVYAVGMSVTAYGMEEPSEDIWTGARGRCRVTQMVQYEPAEPVERVERVFSHLTVERGEREEHFDSAYGLRSYSLSEWREVIGRSGFEIVGVVDEEGEDWEAGETGYRVWVLGR